MKKKKISSEDKFDVIEGHECGHSNATIGLKVRIAESMVEFVFILLSITTVILLTIN